MGSIFELHARVRRLRDTLSYLKNTTAADADRLRDALRTRADVRAFDEWTLLVADLREYIAVVETLASPGKSRSKASGSRDAEAVAAGAVAKPFEPVATIH
jgi:hypothetical protein